MKRIIGGITVFVLAAGSANAALMSRAGGQAYYDTDLDVTWLADANYAQTSGYDSDGKMTWSEAHTWIATLNTANHLGVNQWRLPVTVQPDASCLYQGSGQGSGPYCTASDMGHLFNVEGIASFSPGSFIHVLGNYYWSETTYAPTPSWAWMFYFLGGTQDAGDKDVSHYAWAVHSGDISVVPVPAALWLFGSGVAALGAIRKRSKNSNAAA